MRYTLPNAAAGTAAYPCVLINPPENVSITAEKLFSALSQVGQLVGVARGYHPNTSQVTFFAPVESVALAVGVSRQTVYNRLPELVDKGLVAQTGHYCTHGGVTRADGSLWSVKVRDTPSAAKIDYDWLKGSYRSLADDIATGRTAWKALQSTPKRRNVVDISYILTFALPPAKNPLSNDCKAVDAPVLESLLDVPYAPVEARSEAVDNAAQAVRSALGGASKDINLFRWLVWTLLRLKTASNRDYFYSTFLMVQRCAVEKRENACKNPTGLFISRMKAAGIWSELKNAPPIRVGMRPNRRV